MLPSIVLLATLRLSLLPILAFKSLSSEHASKAAFYMPLFAFLHTPAADVTDDEEDDGDGSEAADVGSRGRDGRLRAANSLIAHAHSQKGALVSRLKGLPWG